MPDYGTPGEDARAAERPSSMTVAIPDLDYHASG
jgi:hypothetical protein